MKTLTLKLDDTVNEKFIWLLEHFSSDEIKILEQSDYVSDDEYLRSLAGMAESIQEARSESAEKGVTREQLDW